MKTPSLPASWVFSLSLSNSTLVTAVMAARNSMLVIMKKVLLFLLLDFMVIVQHGECSYSGLSDYHQQINRLASIKSSYVRVTPPSRSYSTSPVRY